VEQFHTKPEFHFHGGSMGQSLPEMLSVRQCFFRQKMTYEGKKL
jgi:hypothetical protein